MQPCGTTNLRYVLKTLYTNWASSTSSSRSAMWITHGAAQGTLVAHRAKVFACGDASGAQGLGFCVRRAGSGGLGGAGACGAAGPGARRRRCAHGVGARQLRPTAAGCPALPSSPGALLSPARLKPINPFIQPRCPFVSTKQRPNTQEYKLALACCSAAQLKSLDC